MFVQVKLLIKNQLFRKKNYSTINLYFFLTESAHLSFKPPEDDGGLPIDRESILFRLINYKINIIFYFLDYLVERFDPEGGRWVPCGKSKNTEFDVSGLTPGHEYKSVLNF